MGPIRQGDVILLPTAKVLGDELPHLTLVEGISTGHSHRISKGIATLFSHNGDRYLRVRSKYAILSHDEHRPLKVHHGSWKVYIQREYVPQRNSKPSLEMHPEFATDDNADAEFFQEVFAGVQATSQEQLVADVLGYQAATKNTSSTPAAVSQKREESRPKINAQQKSLRNWRYVVD